MEALKKYFYENCHKNNELIGMLVIHDEEEYFINEFDQFCNTDKLPREVLIGKRQGSNYGKIVDTSELFIK
jgi:hypothetical protein